MIAPRWYCVSREGLATLCKDEADANETAGQCDKSWPLGGPHRAVRLADANEIGTLRRQVSGLKGLLACADHRAVEHGREMAELAARADDVASERAANALLTAEIERLRAALLEYMAAFGQGLEAHGIELCTQQIDADKQARAALHSAYRQTNRRPACGASG